MKKTRFTEEQMVTILREADERPVPEVAKKHGVSAQTIYGWRKHFGTLEPKGGSIRAGAMREESAPAFHGPPPVRLPGDSAKPEEWGAGNERTRDQKR